MCTLVSRDCLPFCKYIKRNVYPGNQDTHDKLNCIDLLHSSFSDLQSGSFLAIQNILREITKLVFYQIHTSTLSKRKTKKRFELLLVQINICFDK